MSSVKIDKSDFLKLQKALKEKIENQDNLIERCVNNAAARVIRVTKRGTPVRSGNLRRNWKVEAAKKITNGYSAKVYNNSDYADYVEYGRRRLRKGKTVGWIDGKFMLTQGEDEVKRRMDRIVKKEVEDYLKEVFHD